MRLTIICKLGLASGLGFGLDDAHNGDYKPEIGLGFDFDLQLQQDLE